jgi:excisionase family DNA binding protein
MRGVNGGAPAPKTETADHPGITPGVTIPNRLRCRSNPQCRRRRESLRRASPTSFGRTGHGEGRSDAKDYSIAQSTIRQWIRDGKLRARHVGRALRVNLADFERLVSISSVAVVSTPSPEELADLDEIRDRRSKKA